MLHSMILCCCPSNILPTDHLDALLFQVIDSTRCQVMQHVELFFISAPPTASFKAQSTRVDCHWRTHSFTVTNSQDCVDVLSPCAALVLARLAAPSAAAIWQWVQGEALDVPASHPGPSAQPFPLRECALHVLQPSRPYIPLNGREKLERELAHANAP